MATVDKNFRIKNGLVVEGSTATVNGSNILTENSVEFLQDTAAAQLTGGTHTNISVSYNDTTGTISLTGAVTYTDEQAQDAIGNNLGTGLSYNDSTGAISVDTSTIQARVANVSDIEIGYLDGVTSSIQTQLNSKSETGHTHTASNITDFNEAAQDAVGGILGSGLTYNDPANTISVDSSVVQLRVANVSDTEIGYLDGVTSAIQTQLDAKLPKAGGTMSGAIAMGTNKITGLGTPTSDADAATKKYVDDTVSAVVDGAPDLLNTLNELAAAINDDANYASTLTTALGNKQDKVSGVSDTEISYLDGVTSGIQSQLNSKLDSATAATTYAPLNAPTFTGTVSGITKSMVGLGNVDNTSDANKPVSTATQTALDLKANLAGPTFTGNVTLPSTTSIGNVSATELGYVDGVTSSIQTQLDAKASTTSLTNVTNGTTAFTEVNVNSVAKQIAATTGNIATAAATTAYAWAKASYRSGEFLVKAKNGNHTEVAKIMVTLDSSDNVYITEYGMSSTSGVSLQTVSADVSGTDVRIRVTPANNNTEVLITGILLV